jgi:hypothetical protein
LVLVYFGHSLGQPLLLNFVNRADGDGGKGNLRDRKGGRLYRDEDRAVLPLVPEFHDEVAGGKHSEAKGDHPEDPVKHNCISSTKGW